MNRAPILFRCDGTPSHGWESFYQCLVLAGAMQRRRRGTHFLSRLEPQTLAGPILRGGHEWNETTTEVGSADDLDATIREARRLNAAAIVVAAPHLSEEYLRELDATGTLIVTVDNAADRAVPEQARRQPVPRPARGQVQAGARHATAPRQPVSADPAADPPAAAVAGPGAAAAVPGPRRARRGRLRQRDADDRRATGRHRGDQPAGPVRPAAPPAPGRAARVRGQARGPGRRGDRGAGAGRPRQPVPLRGHGRRRLSRWNWPASACRS